MGNFKIKSIWESKNTGGGNVPADLANRVQAVETKASTNETNITNLQTNTVKITGDQSIAGVKTFTATGEALKINSGTDNSAYVAGYKSNNRRIWYFGKGSSSNDEFVIGSTSNIKLEASNIIHCNSKKLTNVADPAANTDAATKQYVDNRIKTRTLNQNIGVGTTFNIDPTSGYQIVSVQVARKRNSDSFYFFTHNINLNFQTFLKNNTQYAVYNNGSVNDFSNDFRIVILEMKV